MKVHNQRRLILLALLALWVIILGGGWCVIHRILEMHGGR